MCIMDNTISRANSIDLNQPWNREREDTCQCDRCPCCGKRKASFPMNPYHPYPNSPYSPNRQGDFPYGDLMGLYIPKTTC